MTATLLDVPVDAYHADAIGETPSLNATVAKALILETPAHAKQKHPRLMDGDYVPRHTDAMDEGTALHQMLLGDDRCDVLEHDSFRTADAKAARDESRSAGRVPLLRHKWDEIALLGDALKLQVAGYPIDPPLFRDGMAEQTIVWEDQGVTFRARLDWLRTDYRCIDDLKKTRDANPRRFHRSIYQLGYDLQAAFYIRAVEAAFGVTPIFRWVAIEPDPPYAMSVHYLTANALRSANERLDLAIDLWKNCLADDFWPAWPQIPSPVEPPAWLAVDVWDDTALSAPPF